MTKIERLFLAYMLKAGGDAREMPELLAQVDQDMAAMADPAPGAADVVRRSKVVKTEPDPAGKDGEMQVREIETETMGDGSERVVRDEVRARPKRPPVGNNDLRQT